MRNTVRTIFTMDSEVKNLLEEAYGDDYRDDFEDSLEEFGNEGDELEYEDDFHGPSTSKEVEEVSRNRVEDGDESMAGYDDDFMNQSLSQPSNISNIYGSDFDESVEAGNGSGSVVSFGKESVDGGEDGEGGKKEKRSGGRKSLNFMLSSELSISKIDNFVEERGRLLSKEVREDAKKKKEERGKSLMAEERAQAEAEEKRRSEIEAEEKGKVEKKVVTPREEIAVPVKPHGSNFDHPDFQSHKETPRARTPTKSFAEELPLSRIRKSQEEIQRVERNSIMLAYGAELPKPRKSERHIPIPKAKEFSIMKPEITASHRNLLEIQKSKEEQEDEEKRTKAESINKRWAARGTNFRPQSLEQLRVIVRVGNKLRTTKWQETAIQNKVSSINSLFRRLEEALIFDEIEILEKAKLDARLNGRIDLRGETLSWKKKKKIKRPKSAKVRMKKQQVSDGWSEATAKAPHRLPV